MADGSPGRFDGKVAIVTGAGQGIGEAYARRLAAEGAAVVVAELNAEHGQRVAKEIQTGGGTAIPVETDVADPASAQAMVAAACEAFGGIDFLVNNAAIYHGMRLDTLLTVDLDYYHRFMEVNLNGALYCTRAVYPSMQQRGGGSIVNQSSTASWMGVGYYGLSKAALNGLTHCLASELGPMNIRVNAIAPGPTDTEATRTVVPKEFLDGLVGQLVLQRLGQPEDLTGLCTFLLSDESSWITGQIFAADGGQTKRL